MAGEGPAPTRGTPGDARAAARHPLRTPPLLALVDDPPRIWTARVRDLSTAGVALESPEPAPPGRVLTVRLVGPGRLSEPLTVRVISAGPLAVRIARAEPLAGGGWLLGGAFLPALSAAQLFDLLSPRAV